MKRLEIVVISHQVVKSKGPIFDQPIKTTTKCSRTTKQCFAEGCILYELTNTDSQRSSEKLVKFKKGNTISPHINHSKTQAR